MELLPYNDYWIGGKHENRGLWEYKHGKLVKSKNTYEWRWVDGTKMTYTNWGMYSILYSTMALPF